MIKVELHDRANNLVRVLPLAKNAAYHPVLNQDGSGVFLIHRTDPDAVALQILEGGIDGYIVHLLRKGPFETAFTDRFSFLVESVMLGVDQQEDQNAWITVAGRGTLALLEDRVAFPPGFDGVTPSTITSQQQAYIQQNGGTIMDGEIDRSNPRFVVQLTHTINQSTVLQDAKLRFDSLRLLHDFLTQNGPMDAQMVGLDYQCFNSLGTDKSALVTVAMAAQDSLLDLKLERDNRPVKNWVIAQGTGEGINAKLSVATDAPSIAAFRRREGFVDARQVDTAAQLALNAAAAIAQFKAADQRITTKFYDSQHTQLYRDFGLGDTIGLAAAPLSFSSKYRLVGFSVADVDAEIEEITLDLNDLRTEYLIKLLRGQVMPSVGSLNTLNRQPQGAPQIDSQTYPDNCTPTFPFHFDFYLASNVQKVNYAKLSFFLRAFRRDVGSLNTVSSGASSSSSSGSSSSVTTTSQPHIHHINVNNNLGAPVTTSPVFLDPVNNWLFTNNAGAGILFTQASPDGTHSHDNPHTHDISHTHNVTPTLVDGLFEGAVATGVTVKVNGVDRTAALGGGAGFTTNQTELALNLAWLNPIGQWNTIDLTPTGLGRITGHLTVVSYIQSV